MTWWLKCEDSLTKDQDNNNNTNSKNMADQQRRDSDLETEIQLLLVDIRNLNSVLKAVFYWTQMR